MSDLYYAKAATYETKEWSQELTKIGELLRQVIPFHQQMHVMDFGAGTGLLSLEIAPVVGSITAVDISKAMLAQLNTKQDLRKKVKTLCQDIMIDPVEEKFDLIVSCFAMHHIADTNKLIQTFADHLHSGSRIALVDIDVEDGSFHGEDDSGVFHHGFDRDILKSVCEMHFFRKVEYLRTHFFTWDTKEYSAFVLTAVKV